MFIKVRSILDHDIDNNTTDTTERKCSFKQRLKLEQQLIKARQELINGFLAGKKKLKLDLIINKFTKP